MHHHHQRRDQTKDQTIKAIEKEIEIEIGVENEIDKKNEKYMDENEKENENGNYKVNSKYDDEDLGVHYSQKYPLIIKMNLYGILTGQLGLLKPMISSFTYMRLKHGMKGAPLKNEDDFLATRLYYGYRSISLLVGSMLFIQYFVEINWFEWTLRELGWWYKDENKRHKYATIAAIGTAAMTLVSIKKILIHD